MKTYNVLLVFRIECPVKVKLDSEDRREIINEALSQFHQLSPEELTDRAELVDTFIVEEVQDEYNRHSE